MLCLLAQPKEGQQQFKNKKQPELTENPTARGSNTKEIQNKHSSRPVGGAETGTGVERTRVAVAGLKLAECGTNGAGSLSTSRPCGPTFAQIN